ncbi:hypothetical protein V2J09_014571 [Rumex salicifolius]
MEEAKALAQHQQQLLMHQQQQHHKQQQMLIQQQLQQLQQQQQQRQHQQQQQQQQHPQQAAISRFPSNIDAHLRPLGMNRAIPSLSQSQNPNPNPNPNPMLQHHPQIQPPSSSAIPNPNSANPQSHQLHPHQNQQQQQQQQKLAGNRGLPAPSPPLAGNQAELQLAYQDAWRVCHPDYRRPFSSLEDACERLLPYHVVADYEAEEDDRILDSDTTGQMPSRSQQWDHNIAAKVAEFTATFEKQALAFNIITRKRAIGEFRSEERLMIEQALLQEEKRAMLELRAEIESREKAGREAHEAKLRMAAFQAEQARAESHAHAAEMAARAPIRPNAQGNDGTMSEQEHGANPDEMMNGWGNNSNVHREEEPSEDFLNDEEAENGDAGMHEWREKGRNCIPLRNREVTPFHVKAVRMTAGQKGATYSDHSSGRKDCSDGERSRWHHVTIIMVAPGAATRASSDTN